MRIYKYLFYIRDNEVAAYDHKFEYQNRDGNKFQPFTPDFWQWWLEINSFLPNRFQVDFCFLADSHTINFYLPEDYRLATSTSWTKRQISEFIECLAPQKIMVIERGIPINGFASKDKFDTFYLTRYNVPDVKTPAKNEQDKEVSLANESSLHKSLSKEPMPEKIRRKIGEK